MNFITEEMGITSLQACMDSSDHRSRSLQGMNMISNDNAGIMGNSSQIAAGGDGDGDGDILACSRPLIERRLRPNHEQALKCPRCESTHTKFCYYNNYSLTQPRYFCKTCRRYWTKGGTLRNIPVGGGCRKNKKVSSSSKKPSSSSSDQTPTLHRPSPSFSSPLTLDHSTFLNRNHHLAFPEQLQFSSLHNAGFLFENSTPNLNPVEYMQNPNVNDNFCNNQFGFIPSFENGVQGPTNYLPYDHENHQTHYQMMDQNHHYHHNHEVDDVKPNAAKILSLEWHDCNSDAAGIKDSFGYNLGSWAGLMGGYGSSAANPLV